MNLAIITDKSKYPDDPRLGRMIPVDFTHMEKYPLTIGTMPDKPVPVQLGINWMTAFDRPVYDAKDRKWWIGKDKTKLGTMRGGHSVCVPFDPAKDLASWWEFYNQGREGSCVGFAGARMMSLLNRVRYDAKWLWNRAKEVDEWTGTNPGDDNGTSVRAAFDILRTDGMRKDRRNEPSLMDGISANRWATDFQQVLDATQNPTYKKLGAAPILNSWGKAYPRVVWMPGETHQQLMDWWGEYGIPTDR